jgi:hypothetical protein
VLPEGVRWTGDPLFDNYAHTLPGATTRYSSGGYWRLSQALTALWGRDLKEVLDEKLFRHLGIPAERWEWLPGQMVHDTRDFGSMWTRLTRSAARWSGAARDG